MRRVKRACISRVHICIYIYFIITSTCILWCACTCASLRHWRSQRHEERRRIEGMFARDRDREATAEFAILPTALIRREIRSSMVEQLASSPDHMKPSTPSSFSFLPPTLPPLGHILFPIPSHPLPLSPFISSRSRLHFSLLHFRGGQGEGWGIRRGNGVEEADSVVVSFFYSVQSFEIILSISKKYLYNLIGIS